MTKPVIIKRIDKGEALTYAEQDQNFQNLKDATIGLVAGSGGTTVTTDLNGSITLVAGANISLTGDNTAKTITVTGTGGDLSNYVTLTTSQTISGAKELTGLTTLKQYAETVYAGGNTGTGTYTPTLTNGAVQTITATGNFTLGAPSGMTAGTSICLVITQDATGSRTMTANASYKFANGFKTLSTTASAIDVLTIFYTGAVYLCSLNRGYA